MIKFDIYRSGYDRGYRHGSTHKRRRAKWELYITSFLMILPFTDSNSYVEGYRQGYHDASMTRHFYKLANK